MTKSRIRARLFFLVAAVACLTLIAGSAFAQTTPLDPVNTGISGIVTDLKAMITTNIPVVFGLLVLTIGVPFGVRFLRRLAK